MRYTVTSQHPAGRPGAAWLNSLRGDQLPNVIILAACLAMIAGALILTPPGQHSGCIQLGSLKLPTVCTLKNLAGLDCPGCGLVRSIAALAHGQLSASLAYHRLGWLVFLYIAAQFVFRLSLISVPSWRGRLRPAERYFTAGLILLTVLLTLNWIFSFIF